MHECLSFTLGNKISVSIKQTRAVLFFDVRFFLLQGIFCIIFKDFCEFQWFYHKYIKKL